MAGRRIGYAKLGRSMPLTVERSGTLGGDIEMSAVLKLLADRYPDDTIVLVGRNSGESAEEAGLPPNIENPWGAGWAAEFRTFMRFMKSKWKDDHPTSLSVVDQLEVISFFDDLTLETFAGLDEMVMWIGQHGTTNMPLPGIRDPQTMTKPHDWSVFYASFLLRGINHWRDINPRRREEINLNADPRNYHKMRDLKWPLRHPILTQYDFTNTVKHERFGDTTPPSYYDMDATELTNPYLWKSQVKNVYSRLELNALVPGTPSGDFITYNDSWDGRDPFGIIINEARSIGIRPEMSRLAAMNEYVMPCEPAWIYGTWSDRSKDHLAFVWGTDRWSRKYHGSLPWDQYVSKLQSVRCTFTTPSSGSHWATTKPWEAFGAGVVCFFHPEYDTQNNILADAHPSLRAFLQVMEPEQLQKRVKHLSTAAGRRDWEWLVRTQRDHFNAAMHDLTFMKMIDERISK